MTGLRSGQRQGNQLLDACGLVKRFGRKLAVDGVDLSMAAGEIVGFLGPNGAGKTTVMNIVTGLVRPDAGTISLFGVADGVSQPALRTRLAFLQEKPRVYPEMTARGYLRFFAALAGIAGPRRRVDELLAMLSLEHAADRPIAGYSRGMQQRTCLARVLLTQPELLILDEPTLGLDPAGVREMREIMQRLKAAGVAILFSSHQLAEMERVADRIVLMNAGRVIADGARSELAQRLLGHVEVDAEVDQVSDAICRAVSALPMVMAVEPVTPRQLRVSLVGSVDDDLPAHRIAISRAIAGAGGAALAIVSRSLTLEELFLRLTTTAGEADRNQTAGLAA